MMREYNAAIISISTTDLLDWLQFKGGSIHNIQFSAEKLDVIEVIIEHPDLPAMREGDMLLRIIPEYHITKHSRCR